MEISKLFETKKVVYSFEIFPPKLSTNIDKIYETLDGLKHLTPDYISVTYSAGGGSNNARSIDLASDVKNKYKIETLAHLTCVNSTKEEVKNSILKMQMNGIENILALRGDKIEGAQCKDFSHASDLVSFINENGKFDIAGACYPEGHPEAENLDVDIDNLKYKVDKGITHLNSQLFYDNKDFLKFLDKVKSKGINIPIQAGIMPLVKKSTIERTIAMSGVKIPSKVSHIVAKYADDPISLEKAGIDYATQQIIDLLENGIDGIHVYIMNNVNVATKITQNIKEFLD